MSPSLARPDAQVSWSQVWHLPVLLLGLGLFAVGVWLALPDREPDDFPGRLQNVSDFLEANRLDEAEEALVAMQPYLERAQLADQALFWQYFGDLNFLQLKGRTRIAVDTVLSRQTNGKIVEYYARAIKLDGPMTGHLLRRYALSLVSLNRDAEALGLLERHGDAPPQTRYEVIRKLIEQQRARREQNDLPAIHPLMKRFKTELAKEAKDPDRGREYRRNQVWITGLEAELRLEAGDPDWTIDYLLKKLTPLVARGQNDLAPLNVLLARAYQATGDFDQATRHYMLAQGMLDSSYALNAEILVGLGQIALAETTDQNVERALEYFSTATDMHPTPNLTLIDGLLGRADCETRLESFTHAAKHFGQAIGLLAEQTARWDPRRDAATDLVRSHIDRAVRQEQYPWALELLTTLLPLHEPDLPAEVLHDFAVAHENIADQSKQVADRILQQIELGNARATPDAARLANQEAAIHFEKSGRYFLDHARAVTVVDDDAHGRSLWNAASCFDSAQLWAEAIKVFAEFVKTRRKDPLALRAINRLGKAYMADGQYEAAIEKFLVLVEENPHSPEAYDSMVPLAGAYIAQKQLDNAQRVLEQVLSDHPAITPDSDEYRQALIELGKLFYRLGNDNGDLYARAIEKLEEAVERYSGTDDGPVLRFLLADSYRLSVRKLDETLAQRHSQNERLRLQAERNRRLKDGQKYYNQVVTELESRPEVSLSRLERLYYRNAYFYQADCAFDRGQYDKARDLYLDAARRWEHHPASLIALIQVVNTHCELGQFQEAEVANANALWQLEQLSDDAFDDQTLPLSRQHWADWLRWTSELKFGAQASAE